MGKNSINLRFKRLGFNLSIPFNFHPYPRFKSISTIITSTCLISYLGYVLLNLKKNSAKRKLKYKKQFLSEIKIKNDELVNKT